MLTYESSTTAPIFPPHISPQTTPNLSPNGKVALAYAKAEFVIFPCKADREPHKPTSRLPFGKATKAPLVAWATEATRDEATIRQWWSKWPEALVAIPCKPNQIFLLDTDRLPPQKMASRGLRLCARDRQSQCRRTPVTLTEYGGEHCIFRQPDEPMAPHYCAGIETRGYRTNNQGGYFIAPGSQMPDGRGWRRMEGTPSLLRDPLPLPPQWLIDLCRPPQQSRKHRRRTQ